MTRVTVSRNIAAPLSVVFRAITDVERLPDTNPDIVQVEILGEQRGGVGTKFRETRLHGGKQALTELEIVELVPDASVRMVADNHGTVWDSVFTVAPTADGRGTALTIVMDAKAHALLPRLLNPLTKGLFRKGLERHIDALQRYCEAA